MHVPRWVVFGMIAGVAACGDATGAGGRAKLVITVQPQAGAFAAPFAVQPVVEVRDARGNRVAGEVRVTVSAEGGELGGTVTVTAADGVAAFTDLSLAGAAGPRTLTFSAPEMAGVTAEVTVPAPPRAQTDRPDDFTGPQFRAMYVLPSDRQNRGFDVNARIAYSVASFQGWLGGKTGGRTLRMDTYLGALDVGFFRLSRTDAEMKTLGAFVRNEIERQLRAAGLLAPDKLYLVYYDGGSTYACGGASWPPNVSGQLAAMYLWGAPGGIPESQGCGGNPLAASPTAEPGYWEFAMLHDAIHTLGVVSKQAPHHVAGYPAHVPEPTDLMYSGPAPWDFGPGTVIDVGGDDYAGTTLPAGLPNFLASPYLGPPVAAFQRTAALPHGRREITPVPVRGLPPHPPFPGDGA